MLTLSVFIGPYRISVPKKVSVQLSYQSTCGSMAAYWYIVAQGIADSKVGFPHVSSVPLFRSSLLFVSFSHCPSYLPSFTVKMRAATISACITAFASLAAAVSIPGLPSCAGGCVPADLGGCNLVDVSCICGNSDLISNLACCVSTACDKADQESKSGVCLLCTALGLV